MDPLKGSSFSCTVPILLVTVVCLSSVSASNNSRCPTWFYYNSTHQCQCGSWLNCIDNKTVLINDGDCATSSGQGDQYYIGDCPFAHPGNRTKFSAQMPSDPDMLDEVMCGPYNRKGLLCGECIDGYGPAVYSFDMKCVNCSKLSPGYAISLYLVIELLPITLFFICLVVFRFNITSGPLLGYVIFCNFYTRWIKENQYIYDFLQMKAPVFLFSLFQTALTLSQFSSLQFFHSVIPPFCISEKLTVLHLKLLKLVTATYPFVLFIITCILIELHARNCRIIHILWKPFSIILNKTNITALASDAVIHAFASFIFLSNTTATAVMSDVNYDISIRKYDGSIYKHSLMYDPNIEWLSRKHILYSGLASIPFLFLTVIPSILLMIYPTRIYSRCLSRCLSARKRLAITAFAEALNSCFKDGLNGTRDYRLLAGTWPFLVAIVGCTRKILDFVGPTFPIVNCTLFLCFLVSYVQPCKTSVANFSLGLVAAVASIIYIMKLQEFNFPTDTLAVHFVVTSFLPHILVFSWAGYRLVCRVKQAVVHHLPNRPQSLHCRLALVDFGNRILRRKNGYQVLQ